MSKTNDVFNKFFKLKQNEKAWFRNAGANIDHRIAIINNPGIEPCKWKASRKENE
jgi:hypothetical protein